MTTSRIVTGEATGPHTVAAVTADTALVEGELVPTGPRVGADRGTPMMSSRTIYAAADGKVDVGVWECTPGGWAIVDRPDTEVVRIVHGRGAITDADGTVHELHPGTVLTLPRGWSGRWDISETIRKVYITILP
jgi:uncharacterized cupin superfamily protein